MTSRSCECTEPYGQLRIYRYRAGAGVGFYMKREIDTFICYMHEMRGTSANTEAAYTRDLSKLAKYAQQWDVTCFAEVTALPHCAGQRLTGLSVSMRRAFSPACITRP